MVPGNWKDHSVTPEDLRTRTYALRETEVDCTVVHGGTLRDRKGMNLPGVAISSPALTDKDREDARFALELGVDPATNKLVPDAEGRVRQAFLNIKNIAQSEGATLKDCVRLTIYVSDLAKVVPLVEKVQAELWGGPPYPPRTMFEAKKLFDDDIIEVDSVFYAPVKK